MVAPRGFYIVANECMACGALEACAPELIVADADGSEFFARQPETEEALDDAVRAMHSCCVDAPRYAGHNRAILVRLAESGLAGQCDHPIAGVGRVVRNLVRFTLEGPEDARQLSGRLGEWLLRLWPHDEKIARAYGTEVTRLAPAMWLVEVLGRDHHAFVVHDVLVGHGARETRWYSAGEWAAKTGGRRVPW